MTKPLAGKTAFVTGGSRGIGREIALALAKQGANIVVAAKTATPHPKLPGTIHSVAEEIQALGVKALPVMLDIREEAQIQEAVNTAVQTFGGIDILINNASAISLSPTLDTELKRFDLMFDVNVRGTFAVSKACIPHLKKAQNPHILMMSPPIQLNPKWFAKHLAYTMSKYGMSFCVLGLAEEFKADGIAVNALWPKTIIATAAIEFNFAKEWLQSCRHPRIVAEAVAYIVQQPSRTFTGKFCIDEEVLTLAGIEDFAQYAMDPTKRLVPDLFLE